MTKTPSGQQRISPTHVQPVRRCLKFSDQRLHGQCSGLVAVRVPSILKSASTFGFHTRLWSISSRRETAGKPASIPPCASSLPNTAAGRGTPYQWAKKKPLMGLFGGSSGIRTLEPLRVAGFQDRCNRPLCQASCVSKTAILACKSPCSRHGPPGPVHWPCQWMCVHLAVRIFSPGGQCARQPAAPRPETGAGHGAGSVW